MSEVEGLDPVFPNAVRAMLDRFDRAKGKGGYPTANEREATRRCLSAIEGGGGSLPAAPSVPTEQADGGVVGCATWLPLDDNGLAEVRLNGRRITSMPSYAGAEEVAERINAALTQGESRGGGE